MVPFSSPADSKIINNYLSDNIAINRPGDFNQAIMD